MSDKMIVLQEGVIAFNGTPEQCSLSNNTFVKEFMEV